MSLPETLRNTEPKSRKEYKCDFCCGIIKLGEKYNCQTNAYEGKIYTWRSHINCSKIASHLDMYSHDCDGGVDEYQFSENINEEYNHLMWTKQIIMLESITITETKGSIKGHTEIVVDSKVYNEDTIYQDVTLDTYIAQCRKDQFKGLLRSLGS